jgi:hypothetical protein
VVVADARREPAGPLHGVPFALADAPVVEDALGGRRPPSPDPAAAARA